MPVTENIGRRQTIPILYTRGTYYEVGYDVGRTFASLIHSFLQTSTSLNDDYIPAYGTVQGREAYEDTLNKVKQNFPQYVKELEGIADGANAPFYKLFLLHMDNIILYGRNREIKKQPVGCSSICVNSNKQEILGHTEDALSETLNHFYFVSAHIISDKPQGRWNVTEEKFTSLCYAGHLPGYTMSYNHHGLIFSINTISATHLRAGKTPRHFLTRALLAAENYPKAEQILKDVGCGVGDSCSVNLTFLNEEGERIFRNIEIAPSSDSNESDLSIFTVGPGEYSFHCNEYLRLNKEQNNIPMIESSKARLKTFKSYKPPVSKEDVIKMLGDKTNLKNSVFRDQQEDYVKTIAVGIFDCTERTWSLYADNPVTTKPLVVLPLLLKKTK